MITILLKVTLKFELYKSAPILYKMILFNNLENSTPSPVPSFQKMRIWVGVAYYSHLFLSTHYKTAG